MANLSRVVNKATKSVLDNVTKVQGVIEGMQIDIADNGINLLNKAIAPVWRAHQNALKRSFQAGIAKITLIGDYSLVADLFKKVKFTRMTLEEIQKEIYDGHKSLRDEASDEQLQVIKQHSELEASLVCARLVAIQQFLASKGFEVKLSEHVVEFGERNMKLFAMTEKGYKLSPEAMEGSIEKVKQELAKQQAQKERDERVVGRVG